MTFRHGALHQPRHQAMAAAIDYAKVRVGGASVLDADWFAAWNWPASGNMLGNDELSNCCEAADLVLVEGFRAMLGLPPLPADEMTALAKLRYTEIVGWQGTPETDVGSVPAADCFAWQVAPIAVDGREFRVKWATVKPESVFSALRRGPLQLTIALSADDEGDPDLWHLDANGPPVAYHRVVTGASRGGLLNCRTYGFDRLVAPTRVVAADLLLPVDLPAELRTAGIDWEALG